MKRWTERELKLLGTLINYSLFRGTGKLCLAELLNQTGAVQWLILVDQSNVHPYEGKQPSREAFTSSGQT